MRAEIQEKLRDAQERVNTLSAECESVKQNMESKVLETSQILQQRDVEQEGKVKALKIQHEAELQECESILRTDAEESRATLEKSLLEKHVQEIQVLKVEAEEQGRVLADAKQSLNESLQKVEQALEAKRLLEEELTQTKSLHKMLNMETDALKQEKLRLENQVESVLSKFAQLEKNLEDQKMEHSSLKLQMQHDQWEKSQLEAAKSELRVRDLFLGGCLIYFFIFIFDQELSTDISCAWILFILIDQGVGYGPQDWRDGAKVGAITR